MPQTQQCKILKTPNIMQRLRKKPSQHLKKMNQENELIPKLQLEIADMKVHMERCHRSAIKEQQQINDLLQENDELRKSLALDSERCSALAAEIAKMTTEQANEKLTNERLNRNAVIDRDKCIALVTEQESFVNTIKNEQLRGKKLEDEFLRKEDNLFQEADALKNALVQAEIANRKLETLLEDEKQYSKIEKMCYEENMMVKSRELLKYVSDTSKLTTVDDCKKVIAQLECDNIQLNAMVVKKTEKIHNICILYLRLKDSKDFVATKLKCLIDEFDEISSDLTEKLTEARNEINAMADVGSRNKRLGTKNPPILQIVQKNAQLSLENATMRLEVCHMKQVLLRLKHTSCSSAAEYSAAVQSRQDFQSNENRRDKPKYGYRSSQSRDAQYSRLGPSKHKSEFSVQSVYTPSQRGDKRRSRSTEAANNSCRISTSLRGCDNNCCCRKSCVSSRNDVCFCRESSMLGRRDICYCREPTFSGRCDVCLCRERSFTSGQDFRLCRENSFSSRRVDGYGDGNQGKQFSPCPERHHRVNQCGDGQAERVKDTYKYNEHKYQLGNELSTAVQSAPYNDTSHNELNLVLASVKRSLSDLEEQVIDDETCNMTPLDVHCDKYETSVNNASAVKQVSKESINSLGNALIGTRSAPEIMLSGQFCKLTKGVTFSPSCTK